MNLITLWHPRSCQTEKDQERSLHRHLEKSPKTADVIMQYAAGRVKGDIVVDSYILIEIKDSLQSTGQLQRLFGQLNVYAAQGKGKVVVVVCGDSQRDLVKAPEKKIEALKPQSIFADQNIFLVVRGSGAPR